MKIWRSSQRFSSFLETSRENFKVLLSILALLQRRMAAQKANEVKALAKMAYRTFSWELNRIPGTI